MGNKYWLVAVLVAWGKYGWLSSIRRTTCLPLKCCPVYAHTDTGKDTQTHLHHLPTPQEHKGTHKYIHKNTDTTCLVPSPHALPCVPTQQQTKTQNTYTKTHAPPTYPSRHTNIYTSLQLKGTQEQGKTQKHNYIHKHMQI